MAPINISATINVLRVLFKNAAQLCPHSTIASFDQLPIPLSRAFQQRPDIRVVILDKDNCFAAPHALDVWPAYLRTFERLKKTYPDGRLLIVSNSAGTVSEDPSGRDAGELERSTGVRVWRHGTKKPGCGGEILEYLSQPSRGLVTRPDQVVVVGDRLCTDVLMAGMMGSWSVWVRDGTPARPASRTLYGRIESRLLALLRQWGHQPVPPSGRLL